LLQPTKVGATVPVPTPPAAAVQPSILVDVEGAAAITGFSRRTIYRFADAGLMPRGVRVGGARRWSRQELQEWAEGGCKPVAH